MRLMKGKSKDPTYHVIKDIRRNGKRSSEIVENLGHGSEICTKYNVTDPDAWAKEYIRKLNEDEASKDHNVLINFKTDVTIPMDRQLSFNAGYLFLQRIYYQLGLPTICNKIKNENGFMYDLNAIMSRMIYGRILYPSSKLSCYEQSQGLLDTPEFEIHQI